MLGWYGVLAILTGYLLNSLSILDSQSLLYQVINLTGAFGLIVEAASKKDVQPVALNIVWALIALVTIGKILL